MDAEVPANDSTQVTTETKSFNTWAFLRENFAVLSGFAVVSGITLAIVFLFSYLSVFSWHLIQLIQYVDVITFGVIAVGVTSGSIITVTNLAENWFSFKALKTKGEKRAAAIIFGLIGVAILGLYIWAEIRAKNEYIHTIYGAALLFMTVAVVVTIVRGLNAAQQLTAAHIFNYAILAVLLSWFAGQWLAYTVQERSEFDQDIVTKSGEFKSGKIVIVMSRFTVLLQDKTLHVVPTGDITEFKAIQPLNIIVGTTPRQTPTATPVAPPQAEPSENKVK
jgi:hypothetical protein